MQLPETFLDDFDLSIQHGNFDKTKKLIQQKLKKFDNLELDPDSNVTNFNQMTSQQLIDYFIVKSAESELMIEIGEIDESIKFAQKYMDQLEDVINKVETQSVNNTNPLLVDYLKFIKTEFMRTFLDVNRRSGNLEEIDVLLENIETLLKNLKIPKNSPRYIKSQAYNRNYKAIQLWNYGKPEEAKKLFLQCIDDFNLLQAPADVAMIYNNLGLIYLMKGKFHYAIGYFKKTLDYFGDKPNKSIIATLLNNIGEAYREIGNIPQALSFHKETLELRKSIGIESEIAQSYLFLGSLYKSQGRLNEAIENFTVSLEIYKGINHELNIARLLSNIGNVYADRGQFPQALEYYENSILHLKQSGNPVILADSLFSIGAIQRERGNFDESLNKFQQSAVLRNAIGNQVLLAISRCEMVGCYILQGQMEQASSLLKKVEQIVDLYPEHKILYIMYQLMEGIYYQHSIRVRDKVEAENRFRDILSLQVIPNKLEVRTTKHLLKLLLEELQNYGEEVVLLEIVNYLDKLESLAKRQSLLVVLAEIYLIRHQLQLLLGKSEMSREYLDKAGEIIKTLDVPILSQKLDQVINFYNQNQKLWEGLDQLNFELSDRLKLSIVSSSLQNSSELLNLYHNETGNPILIMVFGEGGIISFSYSFKISQERRSKKTNPHLVASFISALNSFGHDTFETSDLLETLTYGDHKLISRRIGSHIISLLYEGTNLRLHQKLIDFELFMKESGMLNFIKENPNLQFSLKNEHIEIIENLFN